MSTITNQELGLPSDVDTLVYVYGCPAEIEYADALELAEARDAEAAMNVV